jgi:hypothetical protein
MYLGFNSIEFEGYSSLANGEWEHLELFNCYSTEKPISIVSLNTMQSKYLKMSMHINNC